MSDSSEPKKTLFLPITGMHCASCVGRVQNALCALPSAEASVNLATETARIDYDPALVGFKDMISVVEKTGYAVPVARVRLPVLGMKCASCVSRVEKAVAALPGVLESSANFATEELAATFVPGMTTLADIEAAVASAGNYQVVIRPGEGDAEDILEKTHALERRKLKTRLIVAVGLTLPLLADMVFSLAGISPINPVVRPFILLALAAPVFFYSGWPFHSGLWTTLKNRTADMNTLVSLGTSAAFFYSLAATLAPHLLGHAGHQGHYEYDTAATIIALILLGRYLEASAKGRAGSAIKSLLKLKSHTALVRVEGEWKETRVERIRVGDRILLRPGETAAVDGIVLSGSSSIDESLLTGESLPVEKNAGDKVIGGSINRNGTLEFEARRVGEQTVLAGIIRIVRDAQSRKAPIQRLADRIASVFVPIVLAIAALTFLIWLFAGPEPRLTNALNAMIAVLIVACPCALGLATPTAIMVGTGRGAGMGILIKSGESLERAKSIDTLVFDKTGTLTTGKPVLTDTLAVADWDERAILTFAAAVEVGGGHPLGAALVEAARQANLTVPDASEIVTHPGLGIAGRVDGRLVELGNEKYFNDKGVGHPALTAWAAPLADEGKTPILISVDGKAAGGFAVADVAKPEARETVATLTKMGIRVVMLTGDNPRTARAVARTLGIEEVHAGVVPLEKAKVVAGLKEQGRVVVMVGDGINDAPALASADLAIAMGSGTDVAVETSDITLIGDDLGAVVRAIRLSAATLRTIKQNLFWAFFYNAVGIPLAAGLFYLMAGKPLPPVFAALAMAFSSVSVVSNSLRLRTKAL